MLLPISRAFLTVFSMKCLLGQVRTSHHGVVSMKDLFQDL